MTTSQPMPPKTDATATAPAPTAFIAPLPPVPTAPQAAPAETLPPASGGSYTRNPITGALTLVTPSTVQE